MKPTRGPAALLAALLVIPLGVVFAPAFLGAPGQAEAAASPRPGATDTQVTESPSTDAQGMVSMESEICSACHGEVVESFAGPHAVVEGASCASCHGDGEAHVEAGGGTEGILSFGPDSEHSTLVQSRACLECHSSEHPRFQASPHATADVGCVSCHAIHEPNPAHPALLAPVQAAARPMDRLDTVSQTCESCHGAVFTQFEFNEGHRLREGILSCASCHNPHEPSQRMRLASFQRETCLECHADKGGPFVFEHGSAVVEGCTACHTPHGSPNRHMLNTQRVAETCYSCHPGVPGFHARFTLDTVCTNCHSAIHGSNLHPAFLE